MVKINVKEQMMLMEYKTQRALAEQSGIDPTSLSYILRNKKWPSRLTLNRLCMALCCHPGEIIEFDARADA